MESDHSMNKTKSEVKKIADNVYAVQFGKKPIQVTQAPAGIPVRKSSRVIKAGDLKAGDVRTAQDPLHEIRTYVPGVLGSLEKGQAEMPLSPASTLESLKNNLNSLTQLQTKLRFMLKELEEYSES